MTIILFGASGRMGQTTVCYIEKNFKDDIRLIQVTFNKKKSETNKDLILFNKLTLNRKDKQIVAIDFSNEKSCLEVIDFCKSNKVPLVSAVTGIKESDFLKLRQASSTVPVLWSSNFSQGVSAIKKLLANKKLSNFKFSITEAHHKHKKDKPSGTAKSFKEIIQKNTKSSVPVLSIRHGEIFGSHHIVATGDNEIIKIDHLSQSREIFSEGAVRAAIWLLKKKPNFYNFEDLD